MNKYCQKCKSIYTNTLDKCPKCNGISYLYTHDPLPKRQRIYLPSDLSDSMDNEEAIKRIERAEEELRLAKLDLKGGVERNNIEQVKEMLNHMSITPNFYTIKSSSKYNVTVEITSGLHFIGRYLKPDWIINCGISDNSLQVTFVKKDEC